MFAQQELWTRPVLEGDLEATVSDAPQADAVVNDIHSQLNATRVAGLARPSSVSELQRLIRAARADSLAISVAGGRHAMGGQQFATGALHVDMCRLARVLAFDRSRGLVTVEAGIQWPQLIDELLARQSDRAPCWTIRQKQTGADRLSIGGALASNIHGRGLTMAPIVEDVESFTLLDAWGDIHTCSRTRNPDLFRLAIGGYGLFGIVYAVTLRLARRHNLVRHVELRTIDGLVAAFEARIAGGYEYGDFQFATDARGEGFLREGVFSCYLPIADGGNAHTDADSTQEVAPDAVPGKVLTQDDWRCLAYLAHVDKARAFEMYAQHYLATHGQIYWSDTHQLAEYLDDYHAALDPVLPARRKATEVITEIFVPPSALISFMDEVRRDFRRHDVDVIYGTIRLVKRDAETYLAWAREPWACVIFNLHTEHSPAGIETSAAAFRRLIDIGRRHRGSYYLTYHRWATREQVAACHPALPAFLAKKREVDPEERFQSDWYRHYRAMFADMRDL